MPTPRTRVFLLRRLPARLHERIRREAFRRRWSMEAVVTEGLRRGLPGLEREARR